jgi:hypothetical protein
MNDGAATVFRSNAFDWPVRPASRGCGMTNRIALFLGIVIAACVAADAIANDGAALGFLSRKFIDLIEWVKFWD